MENGNTKNKSKLNVNETKVIVLGREDVKSKEQLNANKLEG